MTNSPNIVKLSETIEKIIDYRGKTPKKLGGDWADTGHRALSALNVKSSGLEKLDQVKFLDEILYKKWMKDEVKRGDILLTSEAPAGQVFYWDSDEKIVLSQRLFSLRVNNKFDAKYLTYYLRSNSGQKAIFDKMSGSTVSGISAKMFELIPVIAFDLFTQHAIANILYELDSKICLNNKINAELEQVAKVLYDYWFVQFDFPDENGKPYKSSGGKMIWSEELKRKIPESWKVDVLKNHLTIERGISYKGTDLQDNGIPMINLNSFYLDGRYKDEGVKYFLGSINENKTIRAGDLLIATTDVTRNAYIIGKSFILPDLYEEPIVASCDIAKVNVGNELDKYYLDMLFNSANYHRYIKGFASGTLVLHLNTKGIDWYKCLIPPKELLDKYASFKINIELNKTIALKENKNLSQLRDWLLPMLMNGQVKVKSISEN